MRLAAGYKLDLTKEIGSSVFSHFSGGLVYHYYGEKDVYGFEINEPEAFFPVSVELGTGIRVDRFVAGFRFDVLKFEGVIDIGITFR